MLISCLLVLLGNVLIFGCGFCNGLFVFEIELCEVVDLVQQWGVVVVDECWMIELVFELGDILVCEVMVLCIEMIWIESDKIVG